MDFFSDPKPKKDIPIETKPKRRLSKDYLDLAYQIDGEDGVRDALEDLGEIVSTGMASKILDEYLKKLGGCRKGVTKNE